MEFDSGPVGKMEDMFCKVHLVLSVGWYNLFVTIILVLKLSEGYIRGRRSIQYFEYNTVSWGLGLHCPMKDTKRPIERCDAKSDQ